MTTSKIITVTYSQYSPNYFLIGFTLNSSKNDLLGNRITGIIVNQNEFDININGKFKSFFDFSKKECEQLKTDFHLEYSELFNCFQTLLLIHEKYFEEHFNLSLEKSHSGCYQITI